MSEQHQEKAVKDPALHWPDPPLGQFMNVQQLLDTSRTPTWPVPAFLQQGANGTDVDEFTHSTRSMSLPSLETPQQYMSCLWSPVAGNSVHRPPMEPTSSFEDSLKELMELSPSTSYGDVVSPSEVDDFEPLQWAPITNQLRPPLRKSRGTASPDSSSIAVQVEKEVQQRKERRRLQNRRAQQAYRARREELVNHLRAQVQKITLQHAADISQRDQLYKTLLQLEAENEQLRNAVKARALIDDSFEFSMPWKA